MVLYRLWLITSRKRNRLHEGSMPFKTTKIYAMKIKLQLPYSNDYKAGYLNTNKEPRQLVLLVDFENNKTSTSYARYLMSCNLKRYLNNDEHVDHIDNNKLNDIIENLQILTPAENNIKKNLYNNIKLAEDIELKCPQCGILFKRPSRNIKHKLENNKKPCCSRKCGGKYSYKSQ